MRVCARVLLGKRARATKQPQTYMVEDEVFASSEEFGGGLSDALGSSTGTNINFRATSLNKIFKDTYSIVPGLGAILPTSREVQGVGHGKKETG